MKRGSGVGSRGIGHPPLRWRAKYPKRDLMATSVPSVGTPEGTARVDLNHGLGAIVDVADLAIVEGRRWRVQRAGGGLLYAVATQPRSASSRSIMMHRLILEASPGEAVDHVNRNGLDNRRSNLRFATHAQNMANRKVARDGCKGVWFDKRSLCWRAEISLGGKTTAIGSFPTEVDAARAYDRAAMAVYGPFARTNAMLGLLTDEDPFAVLSARTQLGPRLLRRLAQVQMTKTPAERSPAGVVISDAT